jgi:hypothetical protein
MVTISGAALRTFTCSKKRRARHRAAPSARQKAGRAAHVAHCTVCSLGLRDLAIARPSPRLAFDQL